MKVGIAFIEDKIKERGFLFWTIKTKSSNSSGTSYIPSGGGKNDANAEESIEDLNNCLAQIWEYNNEPVIITLKTSALNGRKEGPFILVPPDYEEPEEDEYEAPPSKTRALSGVPQANLTDAQIQKQGYVPAYLMQFELDKLRAQIELDLKRRDFEQEKREHRRRMDEEAAELEAKHTKIDNWANRASRIAETVTNNTKVTGNLLGVALQAGAKVLGVDKSQLETLGAAMFSNVEATPEVQPAYPAARPVETVEATVVGQAAPPVSEIDGATAQAMQMMSDPSLTRLQKKQILMFIQGLKKNEQTKTIDNADASAV
ncbi:MAG: hypothetical protein IPP15_16035 [Saprospiraceae bacterium]|uniref:Uncharacterized protein n=1 Tax=Candidatus Opimibacter skivensis TaxID=2982028 RepID=A0A9D7SVG4_9BACT|nr:hypothetical protein [Candidatus Opimibacter skivensis]